jgi:hypothetical protein
MQEHLHRVTTFEGKMADFRAYIDADFLVKWLNDVKGAKQRRVVRLIAALREFNATVPGKGGWPPEVHQLRVEIYRLAKPLTRSRLLLRPARLTEQGYEHFCLEQEPRRNWRDNTGVALLKVARLSRHGLDWVRQCHCDKWFVTYNSRSRFCSPECKRTFEAEQRKTEEGKKQWREYMRRYRANPKVKQKKGGKKR